MFKKVLLFSLLLMLLWVNTSYADTKEFWGMRVFDSKISYLSSLVDFELAKKSFTITKIDDNGDIYYKMDQNIADNSICGYAWVNDQEIILDIYNYSKKPIKFYFYADEYYLISKDGYFYRLTPEESKSYPSILNPKNHILFSFDCDMTGIKMADINYVMILTDYGRCCLFLRQINN